MRNKPRLYCALMILLITLLSTICCTALAEDTNYLSTDGLVAVQDGYVYFVGVDDTSGDLNDGRETGLADSVDIWRIKDEAGAQKELIKSFPVPVPGGVILYGGRDVIPCGDSVYFERDRYGYGDVYHTLTRVNISTGEDEDIFEFRNYSGKFLDGDQLYYYAMVKNNTPTENASVPDESSISESVGKYTRGWFVADLRTGVVTPWESYSGRDASFRLPTGNRYQYKETGAVFDIKDGYVYYTARNQNGSDLCIKRKHINEGDSEIVIPYLSDYGEIKFCFVQGDLFYLLTEDTLNCIDLNSRMLREAVPAVWGEVPVKNEDVQYAEWYLKRFNVFDGKLYYLKEDGLYVRVPGEGSETRLIPGDTREFTGLALSDHYAYLFYNDTMSFVRVPLTASYLLDSEMLLQADTNYSDDYSEEDGWIFSEYANCVVVRDYSGEALTATVPAQIHGKPVTYVGLSWENEKRPLQSLTIPEGVLVMGYLYSKNLQEISLPHSLFAIAGNGYPYAFMVAEGVVIRYSGTETEWEALHQEQIDPSYWGTSSYAKDITVICNEDGIPDSESEPVELSSFSIPEDVLNGVQMSAQLYDDASEAISVTPLNLTGTDLEDFQDAYEYQLIQRANDLYKSTIETYGTIDLFIQAEERTRNYYVSEKESLHNKYDANLINANTPFNLPALMVNGTIAYLKDGGIGVLEEMGSSFANKVVDMAEDQFGQSLTDLQNALGIKAFSKKDFVYSETEYGERIFRTDDLKSLMLKAKDNEGKFSSAEDAVNFIITFQRNRIAQRSMQLAHDYKIKLMNRTSGEIIRDTAESVLLSAVSGIINEVFLGGNSVVGLFVGRTVDTIFKSMDYIATEYKDPFIQNWKHDIRTYQAETVWLFRYDYEEADQFIQDKKAMDRWVHRWVMQDHPENTLVITRNPDGSLQMTVHFEGSENFEGELIFRNSTDSSFFGDVDAFNASLWVNSPEEGQMKVLFAYFADNLEPDDPIWQYISTSSQEILWQIYVIADDLPYEDGELLSIEESQQMFAALSDKTLIAASGAGAWGGQLNVNSDGSFEGYYYDEDAGDEIIYEVSFSGRFNPYIETHGKYNYWLWVEELSVENTPGTEAVSKWGERIVYTDPPFFNREYMVLTLIDTPTEYIPEMVQGEIGGTFGEWEDYSDYITLTRLEDGWGFFADAFNAEREDLEPIPTVAGSQKDSSNKVFDTDLNLRFEKEGRKFDYIWGPGLFSERAQVYNNDLAVTAGVLSWAIENPARLDIGNEFNALDIYDRVYCCYNFDHRSNEKRYKTWETKDDDAAFAIGRKIISMGAKEDTTLIVIIGRGTQNGHLMEMWSDFTQQGDGPSKVAGYSVNTNISAFEEAMWQALDDFVKKYPINTPKVKVLVTGHSLGGAMTNLLGARITHDIDQISWLKNKATKDDIYVYTFGAIRVTKQESNIEKGYENIHNIYNRLDSYGPEGNWHYTNVSSPEAKFGHTDLFTRYFEEGLLTTECHDTDNYIDSVINQYVKCESSSSYKEREQTDYSSWDAKKVFELLSKQKMYSIDSNGGPTSQMRINADGSFTGVYQGYDNSGLLISSFSGSFATDIEWYGETTGYLSIKSFSVGNETNTTGATTYGEKFTYTDGPFRVGERLLLTLPGTTFTNDIPDEVKNHVYWVYDPYDNYLSCITINKLEGDMLWWLWADADYPDSDGIEPIPIADSPFIEKPTGNTEPVEEQEPTPIPEQPVTMPPTATPTAEPVAAPVNADSNVLVDDDLITIVNLGKEVQTSSFLTAGKYVCYRLSVTNHMDYDIRIQSGKSDRYWESGSVDGVELLLLNLVGESNPPYIRAGETIEVEMAPIGYGYGYQDVDEMVNVIVNINVQNANGETLRDYTLRLDEGQSYQRRQATGYVVYEAQPYGFTYELPDDWKIITDTIEDVEYYGEFWIEPQDRPWMFTYIYLLSPPTLNGGILIEGIPPQVVLTEEDDESIVRKPNIMVDGCLTEVFEYAGQEWYYIRTDAGVIRIYGETPHSQKMREVFDHFIKSIRFTNRVPSFPATDEPAVTLTPTPTAEPTVTPAVEVTATPTTEPTATPTPEPTATPTPTLEPTATPTVEPIAVTAEPEPESADFTEFWVGAWMTNDDVPAEMAMSPNEDGTLHLKTRFLWDVELETEVNPTNNRLMRFVIGDNMYTGIITRQDDGTMNLYFDGGYMLADDESELEAYFNHNEFFFYPVNPEELWNDEDTVDLDISEWVGTWKASGSGHESTMIIMDDGAGGLNMFVTLDNRITITSALEPYEGGMDFDSGDVNGSLTLNRELHVIRMTDVGSTSDDVNNWMDNFGMMVEYHAPGESNGSATPEANPVTEVYEQPAVSLLPVAGRQDVMQVPILYADATSWIEGSSDPTAYAPFRMIDGEETTAFQVSTKTTKLGRIYLYYNFMAPVTVDELWIKNGFWKTTDGKDQYTRNSRIKAMTVDFCYENSGEYRDEIKVTLKDDKKRKDWQIVKLDGKRNVTSVRICVKSIYEGSKFKTDVCVSEVMFVQKTGN